MGVNTHQDDYFEGLFRRTTASYRAKLGKENVPKGSVPKRRINAHDVKANDHDNELPSTSKNAQCRQRILQDRNRQREADSTTTTDHSFETTRPSKPKFAKTSHDTSPDSIKTIVEEIVAQILQNKFENSQEKNNRNCFESGAVPKLAVMDSTSMKAVVTDLVNRILMEKLTGQRDGRDDSSGAKPLKSIIEDIVTEKLKEHLANLPSATKRNNEHVETLHQEMQQKLNLSKDRHPNKTIDSEALMAELLADNDAKSKGKQRSPTSRCQTPEWEKLGGDKSANATGIKRLPRSKTKAPEWQETDRNPKSRSTSAQKEGRSRSPAPSSSGRTARSHMRGTGGVLSKSIKLSI